MLSNNTLVNQLQEMFGIFRHRLMGNLFTYTRDKGLSVGQYGALMHISHKVMCGVSDIGTDLGITNSAASQMLDRLVQLDLITRSEDPSDRRSKQIILTDKGRQILLEGSQANRKWLEDLAQSMNIEQQEQVSDAITVLVEKARQVEANLN